MTSAVRVLIAGAGWRVSRFVVPALLNVGVDAEHITVIRRSSSSLGMLRTVSGFDGLETSDVQLTFNCVAAQSLVDVQERLLQACPRAVHFCDTPIFERNADLLRVFRLSRRQLYSLEDWPLMPNLAFLTHEARRDSGPSDLRIEHFGITGHFLSLYRSLHGGWRPFQGRLVTHGTDLVGAPQPELTMTFRSPKQLALAKASLRTRSLLTEDFHEVEATTHDNGEVLYRVVDEEGLRYYRGIEEISRHPVRPALLEAFAPFDDRKNIHELDKFVGLCALFRSIISGDTRLAYSYLSSARDAITAKRLQNGKANRLI